MSIERGFDPLKNIEHPTSNTEHPMIRGSPTSGNRKERVIQRNLAGRTPAVPGTLSSFWEERGN